MDLWQKTKQRRKEDKMIKNELRSIMIKHGDNNQTLAAALGISPQAMSCKLNEKRKFTLKEIRGIIQRYGENDPDEEHRIIKIFFA